MKQEQAAKLVATLAAYYPNVKLTEANMAAFERELERYPYELAAEVARDWMRRERFFPTMSELIHGMVIKHGGLLEPEDAWALAWSTGGLSPTPGGWPCPEAKEAVRLAGGDWAFRNCTDQRSLKDAYVTNYKRLYEKRRHEIIERELPALGSGNVTQIRSITSGDKT